MYGNQNYNLNDNRRCISRYKDRRGRMDLQLPMQSVPVTIIVVSFNPSDGEVSSIQNFVIKFGSDLYSASTSVSSTNKN